MYTETLSSSDVRARRWMAAVWRASDPSRVGDCDRVRFERAEREKRDASHERENMGVRVSDTYNI